MPLKNSVTQFECLFLKPTRWVDVRAPVEFSEGSVPGAVNLPLLTNEERHEIGITYKQEGQEAAIALGHKLVSGSVKASRVSAWLAETEADPNAIIYCFRGGLRSQTVQSWLNERGVDRPIVDGGYKALRRFFLEVLETRVPALELEVVSGPTGSGKTVYLHTSGQRFLDLEALANHRGSAFGAMESPQPSQADFENALAVEILRLSKSKGPILIENESRRIGWCSVPEVLFSKMESSPKTEIKLPFDDRVENIFRDYILNSSLGLRGDTRKFDEFRRSVEAISRKLGGLRAREIIDDLEHSRKEFEASRNLDSNRTWIAKLLEWYYDPLYNRQLPMPGKQTLG